VTHLDSLFPPSLFSPSPRPLVILKLEDLGIVERQVFVRIPGRRPETLETTVSLEPGLSQAVPRGILFVGEMKIIGVFLVALFSVGLESVKGGIRFSRRDTPAIFI
jgi:hypothetical protein